MLFRDLGATADIARSLHNFGYVVNVHSDEDRAADLFGESLRLFQERGNRRGIAECLIGLAAVAVTRQHAGGAERAARLLAAAEVQFQVIGAAMWPADRQAYERSVAAVRAILSEESFATVWVEGQAMTLEQASVYALEKAAAAL